MKKKYPLLSSKKKLDVALRKSQMILDDNLTPFQLSTLSNIKRKFVNNKDTYSKYSKNRKFSDSRKKIHKKIINQHFKNKNTIDKKDPDLYILGGVPASGKSEVARKYVPEATVVIDNDDFKKDLSKYDKSPIKKYPLAHAALLHREASKLVRKARTKARNEKRDVTLDATMGTLEKQKKIIEKFKKAGYDIHLIGTQVYPDVAMVRATNRFIKTGRYVPAEYIMKKGNKINKNVISSTKDTDTYIILNTMLKPANIVLKSKYSNKKDFRSP